MFASAALTCICDVHIKPAVLSTRKPGHASLPFSSRYLYIMFIIKRKSRNNVSYLSDNAFDFVICFGTCI